ncbi:MAG: PBECR2 nuclease fold domain-containing protein [Butyricicoccaceae bacterium]
MKRIVGTISAQVIALLGLNIPDNTPIFLGDSNVEHMQSRHPKDFEKYGCHISDILKSPDYVARNPKDQSIEYVKEYKIDEEYVKVAVRISNSGTFYARSLYVLNSGRVNRFIRRGTLLPVSKKDSMKA